MYAFVGFICCLAMATTALADDITIDTVSNNDFVQIETFEDYGGDIVPYISDPYIEDNIPNDVVEEITVNQTVVDNSEVLERMDKLDSKLTLLNNSFNSVLSTSNVSFLEPIYNGTYGYYQPMGGNLTYTGYSGTSKKVYDVSDYDFVTVDFDPFTLYYGNYNFTAFGFNVADDAVVEPFDYSLIPTGTISQGVLSGYPLSSHLIFDVSDFDFMCCSTVYPNTIGWTVSSSTYTPPIDDPTDPPSDPSGNDPSQPSINVTYPQEVIDSVKDMKKQLVTLTGVTLLNLIIPMFVSVFKRMVDPFKKRRED